MIILYGQVRPVLSRFPFIGGMEFAFENKPQVEVEFSGVGGQVLAQPACEPSRESSRANAPALTICNFHLAEARLACRRGTMWG